MSTLAELLAQRAALEKQITETQRREKATAIAQVKALMTEYGLSPADLGARVAPPPPAPPKGLKRNGAKVAAKYRNPATGDTWSGRGLQPKWLRAELANGRSLADFAL